MKEETTINTIVTIPKTITIKKKGIESFNLKYKIIVDVQNIPEYLLDFIIKKICK